MPRPTFIKLNPVKKRTITDAFLREFSTKSFDDASLTLVVKQLGIAKGSIYQYFKDKLDLFMYLIEESTVVKMKYVASVKREDYPNYWAFFRALYERGFEFDNENPLQSHFLHSLTNNLNSPSVKDLFHKLMLQTVAAFEEMATAEIRSGHFRDDIPIESMGFALYKVGLSIQEFLEFHKLIDFNQSIANNEPVYKGQKDTLMQVVDAHITLFRPAFDK
jgi:AcrR family transcriptional regulator